MSRIVRAGPKVLPFVVLEAKEQAEAIVATARAEAERLVAEARLEAERTRDASRREAAQAGRAEAASLLVQAHALMDRTRVQAEDDLRRLAVAAAERLVHAELEAHPERVRDVVRGVLERAKRATRLVVVVHPDDRVLLGGLPELANARIEGDPSLGRGDCVVRTDLGTFDGRLVVQLDALRRVLGA